MFISLRSKAAQSVHYRADIDGLRALAVLAVIFFHAKVPWFGGGYVGVDIFFVISGYLITQIVVEQLNSGSFTFLGFYERRVRRIFPALILVVLATTALGVFAFPPQQLASFGKSLLAVAGFAGNLYFRTTSRQGGYFANRMEKPYLLHTWSLAVEEQFYLFFPVLLVLLHRYARRWQKAAVLAAGGVSFVLGVYVVRAQPVAAFYLLPGRAWELLLGALVALRCVPPLRRPALQTVVGAAGLAAMLWSIHGYNAATPFPGLAALLPCAGAAALIYSGEAGPCWTRGLMGLPPLVFLGVISYSLYLWHWPLLQAARAYLAQPDPSWQSLVPAMLLALLLAVLSYLFVESPLRHRRGQSTKRHRAVALGIAANLMMAALALCLVLTNGLPHRFHAQKESILSETYARKSETPNMGTCANFHTELATYADADFCSPVHRPHNILFFGDSHTAQLYPLLNRMAAADEFDGHGIVYAVSVGCTVGQTIALPHSHCDRFSAYALQRALQPDIDVVFVAFSPWWTFDRFACAVQNGRCLHLLSGDEAWNAYLREMEGNIGFLRQHGKQVVLTVPFPSYYLDIPDAIIRNEVLIHFRSLRLWPVDFIPTKRLTDTYALADRTGAVVYDPRIVLCPRQACVYTDGNGSSLYYDAFHLASSQLEPLRHGIHQAVEQALHSALPVNLP